jgi:hypothetical protein
VVAGWPHSNEKLCCLPASLGFDRIGWWQQVRDPSFHTKGPPGRCAWPKLPPRIAVIATNPEITERAPLAWRGEFIPEMHRSGDCGGQDGARSEVTTPYRQRGPDGTVAAVNDGRRRHCDLMRTRGLRRRHRAHRRGHPFFAPQRAGPATTRLRGRQCGEPFGAARNIVIPPGGAVPTGGTFYTLGAASSRSITGDIVSVGINYKFGY